MRKTQTALTALLLGAMLASPAFANELLISPKPDIIISPAPESVEETETSAEDTKVTCPTIEGYDFALVTSSISGEGKDTTPALDRDSSTAYTFAATEEQTTFSLYVTSYAPYALTAVGGMYDGLIPTVEVYGSNDYTHTEWTKIELAAETTELDGFVVTKAAEAHKAELPAYRFYRVDVTTAAGETVTLKELVLYRPAGKMLVPVYDTTDGVDVDEEPIGYKEVGSDEIIEVEKKPKVVRKPFYIRIRPKSKPYQVEPIK